MTTDIGSRPAAPSVPTAKIAKPVVGLRCVECGNRDHTLSDGRRAYPHRPDLFSKPFWFCDCGAFVGCHPGTKKALGAPAGKLTKRARMDAHAAFDPIWKGGRMGRSEAYRWLAAQLGIEPRDCHISHMNAALARRAVAACLKPTTAPEAGAVGTTEGREPQSPTTREGADR